MNGRQQTLQNQKLDYHSRGVMILKCLEKSDFSLIYAIASVAFVLLCVVARLLSSS
jgi:hypothetical protein